MTAQKSEKELAFLHDLYVAPDWGERFAGLVDEHVKLPKVGSALYVAAGTGSHALALKARAGRSVILVCVDESVERLDLARAKADAISESDTEFQHAQLEALSFEDEQFDLVIGDTSLVAPERLPEILAEMVRVALPGATISLNVATSSSFGEFFSVFWEALANTGHLDDGIGVETLIKELPTVSEIEVLAAREGLEGVQSWTHIEEFDYASGEAFLNAPLVRDFLVDRWFEALPHGDSRSDVLREVERIIDADRHDGEFSLSIKATIVVGTKSE